MNMAMIVHSETEGRAPIHRCATKCILRRVYHCKHIASLSFKGDCVCMAVGVSAERFLHSDMP